jgi:hypothetical protein
MTPEILGLVSAFLAGITVGLVLGLVAIPVAVDAWAGAHRRRHELPDYRRRRDR